MANTRENAWTAAELEWLKRLRADGVAIGRCGEILGRTENAVKAKIDREGISGQAARKWTDCEKQVLLDSLEQGMSFQDIADAKLLDRTVASMKSQATCLSAGQSVNTANNAAKYAPQLSEEQWDSAAAKASRRYAAALTRFYKKRAKEFDISVEHVAAFYGAGVYHRVALAA